MRSHVRELIDRATAVYNEAKRKWEGVRLEGVDLKKHLGYRFQRGQEVIDGITGEKAQVVGSIRAVVRHRRT